MIEGISKIYNQCLRVYRLVGYKNVPFEYHPDQLDHGDLAAMKAWLDQNLTDTLARINRLYTNHDQATWERLFMAGSIFIEVRMMRKEAKTLYELLRYRLPSMKKAFYTLGDNDE